ncbi:hypothetical protein HK096_002679 [Nowakowskiella sp. JEL0078]|nr:hypothetical protein HK096_002679 [Nowakowskiella sp. JEL0078]
MSFFTNLRNAKAVQPHPSVPAPITWFNLDLRTVLLVLLGINIVFKVIDVITLFTLLIFVITIIWCVTLCEFSSFLLIIAALGLAWYVFGFFAIYRLIPEWIVVFAYGTIGFFVLYIIRVFVYAISAGTIITLIFNALFFAAFLYCLKAVHTYAIACRNASGGV